MSAVSRRDFFAASVLLGLELAAPRRTYSFYRLTDDAYIASLLRSGAKTVLLPTGRYRLGDSILVPEGVKLVIRDSMFETSAQGFVTVKSLNQLELNGNYIKGPCNGALLKRTGEGVFS